MKKENKPVTLEAIYSIAQKFRICCITLFHQECTSVWNKIHEVHQGGSVAEWLERWTCNSEAPRSSPALTAGWIGSS